MVDRRRTKIVATIGPVSSTHDAVRALVEAGVDAIRLNLSHGTHEDHAARVAVVREVQEEVGRPLALIADLQGPKLRIGDLDEPRRLVKDESIIVVGEQRSVNGELPVAPAVIGEVLRAGHHILIDDGLVRLAVEEVDAGRIRCRVLVGGEVKSHKGVNLPGVPLPIPSLTKKDLDDLSFALRLNVDYIALSFVRAAADVRDLQSIIRQHGSPARVIAKIEKAEAVAVLGEVIAESDAVMVARGDLACRDRRRDRAAAAEAHHPGVPGQGEAGDHGHADARVDGRARRADPGRGERRRQRRPRRHLGDHALGRDGDGQLPRRGGETMDRIARAVEPSMGYRHQMPEPGEETTVGRAMSNAACDLAEALGARAILVPTYTGRTASAVARLRPRRPIAGLSHNQTAVQQMALEWGVTPILMPETENVEDLWARSLEWARKAGVIDQGDRVVLTAGTAVNLPGTTNLIKVEVA